MAKTITRMTRDGQERVRVNLEMPRELYEQMAEFRFRQKIASESEAVRQLIAASLAQWRSKSSTQS